MIIEGVFRDGHESVFRDDELKLWNSFNNQISEKKVVCVFRDDYKSVFRDGFKGVFMDVQLKIRNSFISSNLR